MSSKPNLRVVDPTLEDAGPAELLEFEDDRLHVKAQLTPEQAEAKRRQDEAIWRAAVLEKHHNRCDNCGSGDRLKVQMIVPADAGGMLVDTNGYVICLSCEMASRASAEGRSEARRPINFWVSRSLSNTLTSLTSEGRSFRSTGGLLRYLISMYVRNEDRFDELDRYQDAGTDVKINAWVDQDNYNTFKALLDKRGMTVTDALKALVLMYAAVGQRAQKDEV